MSEERAMEASTTNNDFPSAEETEAFIEAVNNIVGAIAGLVDVFAEKLIPTVKAVGEMMLRLALAHRLACLWDNRYWHWVTWRVAHKLPLFVLLRLPTRWLSAGLLKLDI